MDLRLANINDLSKLKVMYRNIIDNMNRNNIEIWDEIYPCEFFKERISGSGTARLMSKDAFKYGILV